MEFLELLFWAILFLFMGSFIGNKFVLQKYWKWYVFIAILYALITVFIDVNLNFPIRDSIIKSDKSLAPYWLILVVLGGKFFMLGAIISYPRKKNET